MRKPCTCYLLLPVGCATPLCYVPGESCKYHRALAHAALCSLPFYLNSSVILSSAVNLHPDNFIVQVTVSRCEVQCSHLCCWTWELQRLVWLGVCTMMFCLGVRVGTHRRLLRADHRVDALRVLGDSIGVRNSEQEENVPAFAHQD